MPSKILTAAVAALHLKTAQADADELARIREQLRSLSQRVERLERENAALQAQNQQLYGRRGAKTETARSASRLPALDAADWNERLEINGDLRYRHRRTQDGRRAFDGAAVAARQEDLLRARMSLDARINERISGVIGFATATPGGSAGDPRGANVQLDGEFSRKPLYLDLGYIDWTFAAGVHAIAGKMATPFMRPGQSLFWDNDVNPEGVALTYGRGPWYASAYGFWVEENVQHTSTANAASDTTDAKLYGAQLGRRFDLGASSLSIAAMYYDLAAAQGRRPFFNGLSNGNSMNESGGLLFDFRVIELAVEYNARVAALPLQAWIDFAQNQAALLDTAIGAGVLLGKASNPGTWEAGLAYQFIEKDALFAQHIDADFAGGLSDSQGWVVRAGYAPLKNWTLNMTYLAAQGAVDIGNEFDYDRLLLDFNVKF